jgi:hypothetical protein
LFGICQRSNAVNALSADIRDDPMDICTWISALGYLNW